MEVLSHTNASQICQRQFLAKLRSGSDAMLPLSQSIALAYQNIPRHLFIHRYKDHEVFWNEVTPENLEEHLPTLYANRPLLIYESPVESGGGREGWLVATISQPSLVLHMLEMLQLEPGMRVYELGTGSGWNAALLGYLVGCKGSVTSLEIIPELVEPARKAVASLGLEQVHILCGDGCEGYSKNAPYDRVVFTAGSYELPVVFFDQIRLGGLLLIVIKNSDDSDRLYLFRKDIDEFVSLRSLAVSFVPVTGSHSCEKIFEVELEKLLEWEFLSKNELSEERTQDLQKLWLSLDTYSQDIFRSFLAAVDPGFRIFSGPQISYQSFEFGCSAFGLWNKPSCSLVSCSEGRFRAFGSSTAVEVFESHLTRWLKCGRPHPGDLPLRVCKDLKNRNIFSDEWVAKRGECFFIFSGAGMIR